MHENMTAEMESTMTAVESGALDNFAVKLLIRWLDAKFPGASQLIDAAAVVLPWSKIMAALLTALHDFQAGKDFLTILQDVFSQWVTVATEPNGTIRMMAKPE